MNKENREFPAGRRILGLSGDSGFTLIELLIVILILTILVGLAIAVALVGRTAARNSTADHNNIVGGKIMDERWLDLSTRGIQNYCDTGDLFNDDIRWARYVSRWQPKWKFVRIWRVNNTHLRLAEVWWRKGNMAVPALVPGWVNNNDNYYNWKWVYGNIGYYQGRLNDASQWVDSQVADGYQYVTVIVLNQNNDRANYTVFKTGQIIKTGSFKWWGGTGLGLTNQFQNI